jgi:hypothetical protein
MEDVVARDAAVAGAGPCRAVTPEEIAHYNEFGWVMLRGFVRRETVKLILQAAYQRMGEDADSNAVVETLAPGVEKKIAYFNAEYGAGLETPQIRAYIEGVGAAGKALMSRKRPVAARYFSDFYAPKLASSNKTAKHGGNGPTSFHQDFINFSVDRSGGMTFWMALEDYGPEFGTMSFVNGSHRLGVFGNYRTYAKGEDLLDIYPDLKELEMSEAMTYGVGDVTVHSHMTVHGAGANLTDRPRWAYIVLVQPADACFTGAPPEAFDPTGIAVNQVLPDDRFPVLAR